MFFGFVAYPKACYCTSAKYTMFKLDIKKQKHK